MDNVVYHSAGHITSRDTFFRHCEIPSLSRDNLTNIMPIYTQEDKIILAIQAIRTSRKKLSI